MIFKIFRLAQTYLKLLFKSGEGYKRVREEFIYKFNHFINDYRVKRLFSPISVKLTKNQKDYRLLVYKNFDYKYSLFRETFKKYGSNKGGEWKHRNEIIRSFYADLYEEELKEKKITNLLEIGIGLDISSPGSSLRSWKALFPTAKIYGADINKEVLFEEENIKTFFTDQLNISDLNKLKKFLNNISFDVIIDDGLHTYEANINTFEVFKETLSKEGLYFIEDIKYSDLDKYYKFFENSKYDFKIMECLNVNETNANCIIIIRNSSIS
ncbi:hypothetical protein [Candidatus Pelagibacter sp.]|uniref:hypothetical protein n=1 Tax=Candidatus Pelagibacter sp. TaxID=2024849 RepID=UPI003F85C76C